SREVEAVKVVADLLDVSALCAFVALGLEGEQIDEGRLRALDLRRDARLLADERVDEPVERRDHLAGKLEADQRLRRGAEALVEGTFDGELRSCGRQCRRNEGRDLFAACRGPLVGACSPSLHRSDPARNEFVPWA